MKTYAYEIYEELGSVPDAMFHPVGTGGGLWGAYKGYRELETLGRDRQSAAHVRGATGGNRAFSRGISKRAA